jgi:hypothetical protein
MKARGEEYVTPVGFAREPAAERKRWLGRFVLAIFVVLLLWLVVARVIRPPEDSGPAPTESTQLPGD